MCAGEAGRRHEDAALAAAARGQAARRVAQPAEVLAQVVLRLHLGAPARRVTRPAAAAALRACVLVAQLAGRRVFLTRAPRVLPRAARHGGLGEAALGEVPALEDGTAGIDEVGF